MKSAILRIAKHAGLFRLGQRAFRGHLRILCYHGIWTGGAPHYGDCLYMSAARFERRLDMLERLGCTFLGLDDAVKRLHAGSLPDFPVVVTIDDAWYGTYSCMLPLLERKGIPATIYVTTYYSRNGQVVRNVLINYLLSRTAGLTEAWAKLKPLLEQPALMPGSLDALAERLCGQIDALPSDALRHARLRELAGALGQDLDAIEADRRFHLMGSVELTDAAKRGFDLQPHTHRHRMYDFDADRLSEDLDLNRALIASLANVERAQLKHFCYPSGQHSASIYGALEAAGFESATTTDFGLNGPASNRYALARILDCESMSDLELEAKLCGFWSLINRLRGRRA